MALESKAQNRQLVYLLIVALLAFVIRVLAVFMSGKDVVRFGDAPDYLSAAASLCSSGSYPDRSTLPFFRAPGLPFFIVGVTICQTNLVWVIKLALAALDAASVCLIFLLARELFGDRSVAKYASAMGALYPFFIAQVCDVQTEGLFMFLLLASVWFTLRAVALRAWGAMFIAGAAASAAALVRPVGLALLILISGAMLYLSRGPRLRLIVSFSAGALLCLSPWVVRNELRYGDLILVNDAGGYNFWRGTSPEMRQIARTDRSSFPQASLQFETVTSPMAAREIDRVANTPAARSSAWYGRALANLSVDPGGFVLGLVRNSITYWRPWLNPQTHSNWIVALSGALTMLLYAFAINGWRLLRKQNRRLAAWCAVCCILFWALQIPFQVVSRFRIPITDPFLIVFAAASLAVLLQRGKQATKLPFRKVV